MRETRKGNAFYERNSWHHRIKILNEDYSTSYGKKGGFKTPEEAEESFKKYKEEFHVSDEAFKSMSDQWNSVLKSEDILKKQSEAEHLIKDAQGQLEENKPLMEQIRKWSEAYKKSCRL